MESNAPVHLTGSEIHGFHTIKDLDVWRIMEEAKQRWLQPNEIYAILYNSTLFEIHARPVDLPSSGTIALFDRKKIRNFRKDGHNWKKKKDGKTIKEAHEHLKVGNEERIHVYYAHGEDNPSFVRRCYWLLDKSREHTVLVHYRETSELQGSPVTPVNSNSESTHSGTSASGVLSGKTDNGVDHHAFCSDSGTSLIGESIELGDNVTVKCHERTLHDINTLEWDDLLVTNDPNGFIAPKRDDISCLEQWNQHEVNDSASNVNVLPCNNKPGRISSFGHSIEPVAKSGSLDAKLPSSGYFQNMGNQTDSNAQRKEFELVTGVTNDTLDIVRDGLQTQDSFSNWMNYVIIDSPGSFDNQQVETEVSTGHESTAPQSSIQEQVFSINDISPAWGFSTEQTKVIVIGNFHGAMSNLAESNLYFVFGDLCVPAEMVQVGVFRCMALPHTPGLVSFYLSLDGRTPISQVMNFEYRSPSMENGVTSPEDKSKWEEFQIQIRLARMLFSTADSLNIMSTEVSPNALKEAKKFTEKTSSTDKEWVYLIKSIGNNEISFPQAKSKLFEITLRKKLQEWLLGRVVEGCKTPSRDRQGQGIIHLCSILGYTWAVRLYVDSGLAIDFRDARGWTALHWAAYSGREKMVAVLLSAGADSSLVTDPTSEFPGGCIAADLASKNSYDGLAAYLAEKGLVEHFKRMALSGNVSGSLQTSTSDLVNPGNLSEEQLCQKDTLAAYRAAADAANRIQAAFRQNSLMLRTRAAQFSNPETEARGIIAALKIQHAFRNYESRRRMKAAARIQYRFRTRQIRKDFLNMRRYAIKIQAAFRGHQMRKQYDKILWSVGVLEKAILRWRLKRKGMRGLQSEPITTIIVDQEKENDVEDFFRISRKQAEERIERSVVRVQALFRSHRAQQQYRRMKMTYDQTQLEELFEPEFGNDR